MATDRLSIMFSYVSSSALINDQNNWNESNSKWRHPKRNVARVVATDSDAAIPNHSPVASFAVLQYSFIQKCRVFHDASLVITWIRESSEYAQCWKQRGITLNQNMPIESEFS
ncbi:unnamed protein product [Albugo candida]|uniref:Uncharacterized protein n=1 Tax=Albugo candida TaxID=65357 RepID=A0A024GIK2_9STRA|nr:unnamed protein product [Albugo candida]|eukprot:CCI46347.1 unnamed protein product [Albugo candida]